MEAEGVIPMDAVAFYEVSGEQAQCWRYHNNLDSGQPHEVLTIDAFVRDLDIGAMEKAIELVIRRHDSLRTFFRVIGGEVKQCVMPYSEDIFSPYFCDMSAFEDEELVSRHVKHVIEESKNSLKRISDPPLVRSCIFKLSNDSWYLFMMLHHLISDQWSTSVLYKEVNMFYQQIRSGGLVSVQPLSLQFKDYAIWQKKWLKENGGYVRDYWSKKLKITENGFDVRTREDLHAILDTGEISCFLCPIGESPYARLLKFSTVYKVSFWSVITASLQLLFCLSGQKKILITMPVSSRSFLGAESLIGYFVGRIFLYRNVEGNMTIGDFVREGYLEFLESSTNFIYDQEEMGLDSDSLRLYCSVFVNFLNKEITGNMDRQTLAGQANTHRPLGAPQFYALSYNVLEFEDSLLSIWRYNTTLYSPERIEFMAKKQAMILEIICDHPGITIRELMTKLE